jgi:hypothetical protein
MPLEIGLWLYLKKKTAASGTWGPEGVVCRVPDDRDKGLWAARVCVSSRCGLFRQGYDAPRRDADADAHVGFSLF